MEQIKIILKVGIKNFDKVCDLPYEFIKYFKKSHLILLKIILKVR